jgi:hypothetical protein
MILRRSIRSMRRAVECCGRFATSPAFADLFASLPDLMIDFFQLIERFYHYVIRHQQQRSFALYFDGQAEGEPRATSGTR